MALIHAIRSLLRDESGPTSVEYAVMLGLIAVAALVAVTAFGNAHNAMIASLDNFIDNIIAESGLN